MLASLPFAARAEPFSAASRSTSVPARGNTSASAWGVAAAGQWGVVLRRGGHDERAADGGCP